MEILGQRDDRWKNIKLGWSDVTIGGYGCLITCLAMMAGLTPDDVNQRFMDVVGYANLNLVIWAKIKEAIPWLEFEWRGWTYDNAKVLETIKKYDSCIVEVDFDGSDRTDDMHFVLFVGNKKMYDPWTGKEEPTSKYSIIRGFVVIKTKEVVSPSYELQECLKTHKKLMEEIKNKDEIISSQADELLTAKTKNKNLVNEAEKLKDNWLKAEELREKWHRLYESYKSNYKICKDSLTVCQAKATKIEKDFVPQTKLLKKIYNFIIEVDMIARKRKE